MTENIYFYLWKSFLNFSEISLIELSSEHSRNDQNEALLSSDLQLYASASYCSQVLKPVCVEARGPEQELGLEPSPGFVAQL